MNRAEAVEAAIAGEAADLFQQIKTQHGAEKFIDAWIADPAAALAVIYNITACASTEDDHAIVRVIRAHLAGKVEAAAEALVRQNDIAGKLLEEAAAHRKVMLDQVLA